MWDNGQGNLLHVKFCKRSYGYTTIGSNTEGIQILHVLIRFLNFFVCSAAVYRCSEKESSFNLSVQ